MLTTLRQPLSDLPSQIALHPRGSDAPDAVAAARSGQVGQVGPFTDPRQFLLAVMNTDTAPLALRIQAAQALLSAPPGP